MTGRVGGAVGGAEAGAVHGAAGDRVEGDQGAVSSELGVISRSQNSVCRQAKHVTGGSA